MPRYVNTEMRSSVMRQQLPHESNY